MKVKKKYRIKGLTQAQQEWLQRYEDDTMLEPLGLEELAGDPGSFNEFAKWNISHYEDHTTDALASISRNIPYNEDGSPC